MAYDGIVPTRIVAWGRLRGDGTVLAAHGCVPSRTAQGQYQFILSEPISDLELMASIELGATTALGQAALVNRVNAPGNVTKRYQTTNPANGTVGIDCDIAVAFARILKD